MKEQHFLSSNCLVKHKLSHCVCSLQVGSMNVEPLIQLFSVIFVFVLAIIRAKYLEIAWIKKNPHDTQMSRMCLICHSPRYTTNNWSVTIRIALTHFPILLISCTIICFAWKPYWAEILHCCYFFLPFQWSHLFKNSIYFIFP